MRIGVTGAGGFVGSALIERLATKGIPGVASAPTVVAIDARLPMAMPAGAMRAEGDLADLQFLDSLFDAPFDAFVHLAAVPGGSAEADYPLGWRVNVDATVAILDRLARQPVAARLVYASSIAVFGAPLPAEKVDDETLPLPSMSYGAQKLMMEALIADHARRGKVDGIALRLPGIIARPRVKGGHLSAYMSDILHAVRAGEDFVCPVSEDATSWFMSRGRCVDNLIHALTLSPQSIGPRRAFNLPALRLSMREVVNGAAALFGSQTLSLVSYKSNEPLQALFGSYPPLITAIAGRLGFRHDNTATELIARALDLPSSIERGAA